MKQHTEMVTVLTDTVRVSAVSTARYESTGGEVITEVIVLGPGGRGRSVVENTVRFTRQDGLGDSYEPTRWQVNGRANGLATVAEVVQWVAGQNADRVRMILRHPEAFPNQHAEYAV